MTATATEPKLTGEAGLRTYIDEVARGERPDEVPPADVLGDRLAEYFREKLALLKARYHAAAELEQGERMMREAESIPEVSAADLAAQPVPPGLTWGQLVSNVQFLMNPHAGAHPDAMRRHTLTVDGRGLLAQAGAFLSRTRDAAIEAEIRQGQQVIGAVQARMNDRAGLLHLEEAIADAQAKCERLEAGKITPNEAARLGASFDQNAGKRLLEQAKGELKALIAKRSEVEKARREQEADEAAIGAIKSKMQEASARHRSAFAGMDWTD